MEAADGSCQRKSGRIWLVYFLAQHIDGTCGAVVADQAFLADQFDVTTELYAIGSRT